MKTLVILLSSVLLSSSAEERILEENPSGLYDSDGKQTGLSREVGKAIITTEEYELIRAEEERLAKLDSQRRAKEEARLARIAQRRQGSLEPPQDCVGYKGVTSHKIVSGDTLGRIALNLYGNSAYATFLSVYNRKPANKLFIGETLRTPSINHAFVSSEGKAVWEKSPYAIRDMVQVQERVKKLERVVDAELKDGALSEDTKAQLDKSLWELGQVKQDFIEGGDQVVDYPTSTMTQLQSAINSLKEIRKGEVGKRNSNFQKVMIYLTNSYSYALAWGRDGFANPEAKK